MKSSFLIDETTFKLADYLLLSILTCILLVLPLIAESLAADIGYFTSNNFMTLLYLLVLTKHYEVME